MAKKTDVRREVTKIKKSLLETNRSIVEKNYVSGRAKAVGVDRSTEMTVPI